MVVNPNARNRKISRNLHVFTTPCLTRTLGPIEESERTWTATVLTSRDWNLVLDPFFATQSVSQMKPFESNRSCDFAKKLLSSESVPDYRNVHLRKPMNPISFHI